MSAAPLPCYHCSLPVPAGSRYALEIKGIVQPMCCPGCQAVAETIMECGLASYYDHRTAPGTKGDLVPEELAALTHYDLAGGGRTELSVATFANWVNKTANLIEDVGADAGQVGLPLATSRPGHWMTLIWP